MRTFMLNTRALIFLVVVLLLSNIAVVGYLLLRKMPVTTRPGRDGVSVESRIQKDLAFNPEQAAAFHQLFQSNSDSLKILGEQVRQAKLEFYELLRKPVVGDSLVQQAVQELSRRQQRIELQWFRHFSQVRAICTAPQQVKYDSVITQMVNRRSRSWTAGNPSSGK